MGGKRAPEKVAVGCPVCGATECTVKYLPRRNVEDPELLYGAASGVPGTQRLVSCGRCSMIYENPRYPDSFIFSGYERSIEAGHDSQYPMRVRSFERALLSLRRFLPAKGSRVLDVGAAGGAFLEAAQVQGYEACGLEPSRFLVERGREKGWDIRQGSIDRHPFEPGSFDMVCFWDVLEHVPSPRRALGMAHELLKPGGVLLVNFPDIGTWQARAAGERFWWILSVHLHHFTQETLGSLCQACGFDFVHAQRYWQTLEAGYLLQLCSLYFPLLGRWAQRLVPGFLQRRHISYYASQTTYLAVKRT